MSRIESGSGAEAHELWDVVDGRTGVTWGRRLSRASADRLAKQLGAWTSVEPHIEQPSSADSDSGAPR